MALMNDIVSRLADELVKLPSIGPRAAGRLAEFMLRNRQTSSTIIAALSGSIERVTSCSLCNRLIVGTSGDQCDICSDSRRDHATLMIVAKDSDIRAIERFSLFHGVYYVLGGYIPLTVKDMNDHHFVQGLIASLKLRSQNVQTIPTQAVDKIIVALNATTEGEHTLHAVQQAVGMAFPTIEISTLGRGLSTGSELEYVDNATFKAALESSKRL